MTSSEYTIINEDKNMFELYKEFNLLNETECQSTCLERTRIR